MNKNKLFILFSIMISLFMCVLTSSKYLLNINYFMQDRTLSLILKQIVSGIFKLWNMRALNIILVSVFLLNSIILILCSFKTNKLKHYSLWSILILIMGFVVFVFNLSANINYYELLDNYEQVSLKIKIIKSLPSLLIVLIPTFFLLGIQVYIIRKNTDVKLSKHYIIFSTYIAILVFLTVVTFCDISLLTDYLVYSLLRLRIPATILGDQIYGTPYANIGVYIFYVIILTVVFTAFMVFNKIKSKKMIK